MTNSQEVFVLVFDDAGKWPQPDWLLRPQQRRTTLLT